MVVKAQSAKPTAKKLLFILSMYDLLLPPGMRVLKGGTVKEQRFCFDPV